MEKEIFSPLVSIIIPVYNGSNYMREAIDSALAQTYKNIEIIVVNDGSKDNTDEIARSYGDKIRYFAKENGGVATALNLAIKEAKGDYISWLSHDDMYLPNKVERQIQELKTLSDKNTIIYSNFNYMNKDGKIFADGRTYQKNMNDALLNVSLYPLLKGFIHGCALLIRKALYLEFGCFDVSLRATQDYKLFFAVLKKYPIRYIDEKLLNSRVHEEQGSNSFGIEFYKERINLWDYIIDTLSAEDIKKFNVSLEAFWYELYDTLKLNNLTESYLKALLKIVSPDKPSILLTTSMKAGGLGRYIHDLKNILKDEYNVFVLYSNSEYIEISLNNLVLFKASLSEPIKYNNYYTNFDLFDIVYKVCLAYDIKIILSSGYINFGFSLFEKLHTLGLTLIWAVHDYSLCCLSQHFLSNNHQFCNFNQDKTICQKCGHDNIYAKIAGAANGKNVIEARNFIEKNFLSYLDKIIFPSYSSKEIVQRYYKNLDEQKTTVLCHGIADEKFFEIGQRKQANGKLKIGILGHIAPHKGLRTLEQILVSLPADKFEFFVFGSIPELKGIELSVIAYNYDDNVSLLMAQNNIDVILLLSPLPEAFGYTLSEASVAEIPVIATKIGAYQERIEKNGCGWLVNLDSAAAETISILNQLAENPNLLEEKKEKFQHYKEKKCSEMKTDYLNLLKSVETKETAHISLEMKQILLLEVLKRCELRKDLIIETKFKYAKNKAWRFLYRVVLRNFLKVMYGKQEVKQKYDKRYL